MILQLDAYPNPGDVFTLAFKPTGLGNPFDNAGDWYSAAANDSQIVVTNVNFNSGFLTDNEIDVTMTYNGPANGMSYREIGQALGTNASSSLWGYTLIGAESGGPSSVDLTISSSGGLPSSTSGGIGGAIPGITKGASNIVELVVLALLAIGITFMFAKKEVLSV